MIILILELAAGIAGYVWQNNVENEVNKWFNTSMQQYPKNMDVKHTWDIMQVDVRILQYFNWENMFLLL